MEKLKSNLDSIFRRYKSRSRAKIGSKGGLDAMIKSVDVLKDDGKRLLDEMNRAANIYIGKNRPH